MTTTIKAGDMVMADAGDDTDTGRVLAVTGDVAVVGWDSGVKTTCPVGGLRVITEAERDAWRDGE